MTQLHLRSGRRIPWEHTGMETGSTSRFFRATQHAWNFVCSPAPPLRKRRWRSRCPLAPMMSGTSTWRACGQASCTVFECMDRMRRRTAIASTPTRSSLDPYTRAIGRPLSWSDAMFGYQIGHSDGELSFDERDNAAVAPLSAVIDPRFKWGSDRPPRVPWEKTVIYEAHVRGLTMQHPGIATNRRGTYSALASRKMISHLRRLGITTVELLPVQYHLDERRLVNQGLINYWGYSPLAYFAPNPRYASYGRPQSVVNEFKQMVKRLHAAGIEVLLDVVYNHTGEGNQFGPTICYRGVDNSSYYRLDRRERRHYVDFSGCGNCLEVHHPVVLKLIVDSLRYWVQEMHVDGFRFDLAPVLGRDHHHFNPLSSASFRSCTRTRCCLA